MSACCPACGQPLPDAKIHVDTGGGFVVVGERSAHLRRREMQIFGYLLQRRNRVTGCDDILAGVWGSDDWPEYPHVINNYVCRIRRKVKPLGIEIRNTWGVGYQLRVPA